MTSEFDLLDLIGKPTGFGCAVDQAAEADPWCWSVNVLHPVARPFRCR